MPSPGFKPRADVAERRAKVLRMRIEHRPYSEIAETLGISVYVAKIDYQRGLEAYAAEQKAAAGVAVEQELAKLDQLEEAVYRVLLAKHYTVSNGKLIYLGDDPLEDDHPVLQATDRLLRIAQRRAALRGYDAPRQVEVSGARAAEIEALAAGLGIAAGLADVDAEGADPAPGDAEAGEG